MMFFPIAIMALGSEADRAFVLRLYDLYNGTMFRMALTLVKCRHDAEDIVNDVYLGIIRRLHAVRQIGEVKLEGYMIAAVKNSAYMLYRRRRQQDGFMDEMALEDIPDEDAQPDRALLESATISELMSAIQRLSEEEQTLIRMRYYQKYTDSEIAEEFGIKEVSVRSRFTRVHRKLRGMMEEMNRDD